jgi:hypothetical protein
VDLAALEQAARGRQDQAVYDYVAGGADAELTPDLLAGPS